MKKVMVGTTTATGAVASMPARCVALYDYEPQADDELALIKGDVLQIADTNDDGWWEGTIVSLGGDSRRESLYQSGLFPFNYVQALPAEDGVAEAEAGEGGADGAGAVAGGATTATFQGTTPTGSLGRTTSNGDTVLFGSQELGGGSGIGNGEANRNAPAAGDGDFDGEPMLVVHAPPSMATSNVLYSPEAARATEAMPTAMAGNNATAAEESSAVKAAALSGMRVYENFAASNKPSSEPLPLAAPVDVGALGRTVNGLGDVEAVGQEVDAIVNAEQDLSSEMLNTALQCLRQMGAALSRYTEQPKGVKILPPPNGVDVNGDRSPDEHFAAELYGLIVSSATPDLVANDTVSYEGFTSAVLAMLEKRGAFHTPSPTLTMHDVATSHRRSPPRR